MDDLIRGKLEAICNRYGISAIYTFGSRASEISARIQGKGFPSLYPRSDVDVGVQTTGQNKLSVQDKVKLAIEVEDLFSVPRVDLVVLRDGDPFLALDVIRGELLFCLDLDQQAEDELHILRRAGDLAYFERERMRKTFGSEIS